MDMRKSDFTQEDDYIISTECQNCGAILDDEVFECEECGSTDVIFETAHEGMECVICGNTLDCDESAYRHDKTDDIICNSCYNNLEE